MPSFKIRETCHHDEELGTMRSKSWNYHFKHLILRWQRSPKGPLWDLNCSSHHTRSSTWLPDGLWMLTGHDYPTVRTLPAKNPTCLSGLPFPRLGGSLHYLFNSLLPFFLIFPVHSSLPSLPSSFSVLLQSFLMRRSASSQLLTLCGPQQATPHPWTLVFLSIK